MRDTPDKRNYQRSSSTVVRDRVENKILSAARTQGGIVLERFGESIIDSKAISLADFFLDRRYYRMCRV